MGYPSSPDAFLEKFTGQARDPETANVNSMTGLDWMRARYYSSSQGRFQSVDPANAGRWSAIRRVGMGTRMWGTTH